MTRISLLILMTVLLLGVGCSADQRERGERENLRFTFSSPVLINERQKNLLRMAAENVGARTSEFSQMLVSMETPRPHDRETALTKFKEELKQIDMLEGAFRELASDPNTAVASKVFFGDLRTRYDETSIAWSNLTTNTENAVATFSNRNDFSSTRNQTLTVFQDQRAAYKLVAETGSETFDLAVKSVPPQAQISYRRKGDSDYAPNPDPTNTEIKNLVVAVWLVHAHLDGYEDDEKEHNALRQTNHQVDFVLRKR